MLIDDNDGLGTIEEPARRVPVYGQSDVLVVGGGPAGFAAAVAAARQGVSVILVERYGHLGGLSTGGLVYWIDRMTDWQGNLLVAGAGQELIGRCGRDATWGPRRELWGSQESEAVAYWSIRSSAHRGVVDWAPTVDPEMMKCVCNDMVREAGVKVLLHCWAVAAIREGDAIRGIVFESKQGRHAVLAKTVIDCTGDGDIFALAGAEFENDVEGRETAARMNTAFRFGNVDSKRYLDFRLNYRDEHDALMAKASEAGVNLPVHPGAYDSLALFMGPRFSGYSPLSVADLTEVEFRSRDEMRKGLAWFRAFVPGFETAWIFDTASQIGTRHARRLRGVKRVSIDHWKSDGSNADSIGLCPGLSQAFPTLEIPYGALVPQQLEGLLAAGRDLSADPQSFGPLREVPECWVMGQGAGVAAALSVQTNVALRDVNIGDVQEILTKQGAIVERPTAWRAEPEGGQPGSSVGTHPILLNT